MARLREAIGGGVRPPRMALRAAVFQSVTTSALAGVPILDTRFIAPIQTIRMKKALMSTLLSANRGPVLRLSRFLCQACSEPFFPARQLIHSIPHVNVYNRGHLVGADAAEVMRYVAQAKTNG